MVKNVRWQQFYYQFTFSAASADMSADAAENVNVYLTPLCPLDIQLRPTVGKKTTYRLIQLFDSGSYKSNFILIHLILKMLCKTKLMNIKSLIFQNNNEIEQGLMSKPVH